MNKKLTILLSLCAACAVLVLKADTYTNGIQSPRIPLSDQQYQKLVALRRMAGETNTPLAHFMTNYTELNLNFVATDTLRQYKLGLCAQIMELDDDVKLRQIFNLLNLAQ